VLQQEEGVRQLIGLPLCADALLQDDGVEVGNCAQVAHPKLVARHVLRLAPGLWLASGFSITA
jgi:hypothetical protein